MKKSEINTLWVGDRLKSVKSGIIGRFEGVDAKTGKLRIKSNQKIYLIPHQNLELIDEEEPEQVNHEFTHHPEEQAVVFDTDVIDLHIEKLRPDLQNSLPERIVDIQLKTFTDFLSHAKESKKRYITVIHGRGAGVLRQHIHEILKSDKEVFQYNLINNDGATEVFLS